MPPPVPAQSQLARMPASLVFPCASGSSLAAACKVQLSIKVIKKHIVFLIFVWCIRQLTLYLPLIYRIMKNKYIFYLLFFLMFAVLPSCTKKKIAKLPVSEWVIDGVSYTSDP